MSMKDRITLVDKLDGELSLSRQCSLLSISRSNLYYSPIPESDENLAIMRKLDEWYIDEPFYGGLRLLHKLRKEGFDINLKRVRRLMKKVNWHTLYPTRRTTIAGNSIYKYPYLLKGLKIERANQVWAIDITYIPMKRGFMYLFAIIDLHTRYIVNWSVSNSMTADWCLSVIKDAIELHGKPDIINSDQGTQFMSKEYILFLTEQDIKISMDSKGRALDNIFIERFWRSVKYEHIYLNVYSDGVSLCHGLREYFDFYNNRRLHQSLEYQTPASIFKRAA